ncbi:undecaprenyl-phosphate galactose phosphotransferase [Janibacter hoylei PVAS-1]|uniref:Undecaprenyl-phosphate galactose phosphotransferase n=1 Tax=Janibacter hoylei PVAS-1 TaxID=1210046 RepID=K1E7G5_9MICO|nr:undecaprenyl-phosphate galactose phosphotransferase [Janibacter hoylei PVAS-1]
MTWYESRGKRLLDIAVAGALALATSPIHIVCAAAVRITSGSPVYFCQERPGLHGHPFKLIKFRTMEVGTHERSGGYPQPNAITPVGSWLRRTSLDELPQLLNILRGDMSLVGPRPGLHSQAIRYTDEQRRRLNVRPGLTGLAQIEGRNASPWSARIEADLRYLSNVSLWNDLKILLLTIPAALRGVDQHVGQTQAEVDDLSPVRLAPPGWPK